MVADAESLASESGLVIETDVAFWPSSCVVPDDAEEHRVEHIVMGDHGTTGSERMVLGSVAEMVVARSPVTVTVVRDDLD